MNWEAWNLWFQWLEKQWPVILFSIVTTVVTLLSPWSGGVLRLVLGGLSLRRQSVRPESQTVDKPIRLTGKQSKRPSKYLLKGKRLIATGIITKLDYLHTDRPKMELYGFPFVVDTHSMSVNSPKAPHPICIESGQPS